MYCERVVLNSLAEQDNSSLFRLITLLANWPLILRTSCPHIVKSRWLKFFKDSSVHSTYYNSKIRDTSQIPTLRVHKCKTTSWATPSPPNIGMRQSSELPAAARGRHVSGRAWRVFINHTCNGDRGSCSPNQVVWWMEIFLPFSVLKSLRTTLPPLVCIKPGIHNNSRGERAIWLPDHLACGWSSSVSFEK